MNDESHDAVLTQFLSMTEDRVDPEVAQNLLAACNWDVGAAMEQLFGDGPSRPQTASSILPPSMPAEQLLGPGVPRDDSMEFGEGDGMEEAGEDDVMLNAAIRASYGANTSAGRAASEDELMAQALRMSQAEEDVRQRQQLRSQQEAELAESILMDQVRERTDRDRREAEEQVAALEADEARRMADDVADQATRAAEENKRKADEVAAKRASLPEEPAVGTPDRIALMFRLPSGAKIQRAFRSSDLLDVVYNFVDVQGGGELDQKPYRLAMTMPRKMFEDRTQTLAAAGITSQCVLMVDMRPEP